MVRKIFADPAWGWERMQIWIDELIRVYGYGSIMNIPTYRWSDHMTANQVILPDGTKSDAHDIICEGCEKAVSEHSCGGSVTITTGAAAPVRSSAPRKAAADIVPCPHCKGRMHMNLPAATVNFECFMRQYWTDTGVITDPLSQRLPVWTVEDLENAIAWSKTLATPITYGKMESAAGGSGTYSSTRPKADPKEKSERPKKRKAAAAGERIEDMVSEVADDGGDLGSIDGEAPADPVKEGKSKRSRKNKAPLAAVAEATLEVNEEPVISFEDTAEEPPADLEAERERKRAERRRILAGSR
jgi:hypothetical protein